MSDSESTKQWRLDMLASSRRIEASILRQEALLLLAATEREIQRRIIREPLENLRASIDYANDGFGRLEALHGEYEAAMETPE